MWVVFVEVDNVLLRAFEAACELGFRVCLVTTDRSAADDLKGVCERIISIEEMSFDSVASVVETELRGQSIRAFWTLKDFLTPMVARLNSELGATKKIPSARLLRATKNKYELRRALKDTPYNPDFVLWSIGQGGERPLAGRSVVVKPLLGYGSIGVEAVLPEGDFQGVVARSAGVLSSIARSVKDAYCETEYDTEHTLLVEELIEGEEFSAEVFANENGVRCIEVCGKSKMVPPNFEEISYCCPANISPERVERLRRAAEHVARVLGLRSGMAHVEFRETENEIKLLDVGLRLGGSGLTHDLIALSSGIDMVKAVLAELLEVDSEPFLKPLASDIALLYLYQVSGGGTLKEQPGNSQPHLVPELVSQHSFARVGDRLTGYPAYSGTPGYVLFRIKGRTAESYARVDELLKQADQLFALEYEEA